MGFVGPAEGGEVAEDGVEGGVYHVVIVVVDVMTTMLLAQERELELWVLEVELVEVLGLE
jgi:hypothetical protein